MIVAGLLVGGAEVFSGWNAYRAWADPSWKPGKTSGLLLIAFGQRAVRGAPRSVACRPIIFIAWAVMVAVLPAAGQGQQFDGFQVAVFVVGTVGVLAGVVLSVTTIWAGRPAWLVPPRLRDASGDQREACGLGGRK